MRSFEIDTSLLPLILHYGVPLVALLVFVGELGVPTGVPAEVALLLVGAYAVHSLPALIASVLLVSVADLSGTVTLHLVARTGGHRLLTRVMRRHEPGPDGLLERWHRRLGGHEVATVFLVRLLPLVRMYAAIGTGLMRIRFRNFVLGAAPGALLWAGTPLIVGYLFRADVQRLTARYTAASNVLLVALPFVGLAVWSIWWIRRGDAGRARLRRVRAVIGGTTVLVIVGYLARGAWLSEQAVDRGATLFPLPVLLTWLIVLVVLALVLLVLALMDLRGTHGSVAVHQGSLKGPSMGEWVSDLAWVILMVTAVAVVIMLEVRYPEL